MAIYVGIDLGTTNSTVSVIEINSFRDNPIEKLKSYPIYQYGETIYEYDMDSTLLPSALYFDLDKMQVYTGRYAKKIYSDGDRPMQSIRSVKTRIGGESMIEISKLSDRNETVYFDMVQCSALILKTILQSLEKQFPNEDISKEVVVTVPAAFNNDERQATINAVLLAGFKKYHILDEPTAALLYYVNGGDSDLIEENSVEEGQYKLVYDIGGGTLDVCIAKIIENDEGDIELDIVARSPRMNLGGDNFDQVLAAYFLSEFEQTRTSIEERNFEDQNRIIARIVSKAEEYKIDMNNAINEKIDNPRRLERIRKYPEFELIDDMFVNGITLTKEVFDKLFLEFTHSENGLMLKPVRESLKDAKLKKEDISEILLTGGMSNFYAVESTLRGFFGNDIMITPIDTETSVSKGAAIYNYTLYEEKLKKLKLKDRMSDDIFIKVGNSFEKFIPRELENNEGEFEYEIPYEDMVDIPVFLYYGINDDHENYTALSGSFIKLDKIYKKGERIKLKWSIDRNKIININLLGLNANLQIKSNKDYNEKQIKNNLINELKINKG